jgi:hypothetical protein
LQPKEIKLGLPGFWLDLRSIFQAGAVRNGPGSTLAENRLNLKSIFEFPNINPTQKTAIRTILKIRKPSGWHWIARGGRFGAPRRPPGIEIDDSLVHLKPSKPHTHDGFIEGYSNTL